MPEARLPEAFIPEGFPHSLSHRTTVAEQTCNEDRTFSLKDTRLSALSTSGKTARNGRTRCSGLRINHKDGMDSLCDKSELIAYRSRPVVQDSLIHGPMCWLDRVLLGKPSTNVSRLRRMDGVEARHNLGTSERTSRYPPWGSQYSVPNAWSMRVIELIT